MSKRDPRQFEAMPSERRRKARLHPAEAMATEFLEAGERDLSDVSELPDAPDTSGKPGLSDKSDVPEGAVQHPSGTRRTKQGETVRRATFWFTEIDLQSIARLQRELELPDLPGVPDKSAVVREAVRRLAAQLLPEDGTPGTV